MTNRISKTKAQKFAKILCGNYKNLQENNNGWVIVNDGTQFSFWYSESKGNKYIYVQFSWRNFVVESSYYNFDTLEWAMDKDTFEREKESYEEKEKKLYLLEGIVDKFNNVDTHDFLKWINSEINSVEKSMTEY